MTLSPVVLRLEPTDKDALSAKLFLLIQTDQYESALEHVQQNLATGSSGASHRFEQAYLLYRLQKESEASGVLREIQQEGSDSRASMHLEAQIVGGIYYRCTLKKRALTVFVVPRNTVRRIMKAQGRSTIRCWIVVRR